MTIDKASLVIDEASHDGDDTSPSRDALSSLFDEASLHRDETYSPIDVAALCDVLS